MFFQFGRIITAPIKQSKINSVTTPSALNWLSAVYPLSTVLPVSPENFKTGIIHDDISRSRLFPSGLVVRHSEMFELMECNVDDLYHGRVDSVVLGTKDSEGHYDSLSIGTDLICEVGRAFFITYYGKVDIKTMMAHFIRQMAKVVQDMDRARYIALCSPHTEVVTEDRLFYEQLFFLNQLSQVRKTDMEQYIVDLIPYNKSNM